MKNVLISLLFWGAMITNVYAETSDTVEFNVNGRIIAGTCNITTPNQTVNLGTWQTKANSGIGSGVETRSTLKQFSLNMDCPAGLNIKAQLEGHRYDENDPYFIALEPGENTAKGVVVVLHVYDNSTGWKSLKYDENIEIVPKTRDGKNTIKLRAGYRQVASTITPGIANSSVTLNLTYQ